MAEFKRIKMYFFLMPLFTAAQTRQGSISSTVRDGDEVTLSCENVIKDQNQCDSTTWRFTDSRRKDSVELVTHGQIGVNARTKSDRLSVTANCSLVIKKVTAEDAGGYYCQQWKSDVRKAQDALVELTVVTMNKYGFGSRAYLQCAGWMYEQCEHTVKWLFNGKDVEEDDNQMMIIVYPCYTYLIIPTSHHIYTSRDKLLTCEVTDKSRVQLFPFRLQQPSARPKSTTTKLTKSTKNITKEETDMTGSATDESTTAAPGWLVYVLVAVALLALLIIVVTVIRWKRTKGSRIQTNDNVELTSDPAVPQSAAETRQNSVSYSVRS